MEPTKSQVRVVMTTTMRRIRVRAAIPSGISSFACNPSPELFTALKRRAECGPRPNEAFRKPQTPSVAVPYRARLELIQLDLALAFVVRLRHQLPELLWSEVYLQILQRLVELLEVQLA